MLGIYESTGNGEHLHFNRRTGDGLFHLENLPFHCEVHMFVCHSDISLLKWKMCLMFIFILGFIHSLGEILL